MFLKRIWSFGIRSLIRLDLGRGLKWVKDRVSLVGLLISVVSLIRVACKG